MPERKEQISSAKAVNSTIETIIGNQNEGAIVKAQDGTLYALKHSRYRFAPNNGLKDGDYRKSDLVPISYRIDPLPTHEETITTLSSWLDTLKSSEYPQHATVGIEIEATCYDTNGNTATPYCEAFKPEDSKHPELLAFTLETATKENGNGLARNPVEVAEGLAQAVTEGYNIASLKNLQLVYSSVAEAGSGESAQITPHPYLLSFSPLIVDFTLKNAEKIPDEVLKIYQKADIDVIDQMRNGILNWPVNALHVHTGMPQSEDLVDSRAAHASGLIRLTEFLKVVSFMLYNSRHLYGEDIGIKDVRSITRRLVASAHNGAIPLETEALVSEAIQQLKEGNIHSLPRYPHTGQHDRVRFRMDGNKKTIESIDAPMCPDLRLVLIWSSFNQVSDVIALDALREVGGSASDVIPYLRKKWGNLFSLIPTMGLNSSYEQDLSFNINGYNAKSPIGGTYKDNCSSIKKVLHYYSGKYPAIKLQVETVCYSIDMQNRTPVPGLSLIEYLGVEKGVYQPNGLNRGLITDYKDLDPREIVMFQSEATRLQAESLAKIRDDYDYAQFIGMK